MTNRLIGSGLFVYPRKGQSGVLRVTWHSSVDCSATRNSSWSITGRYPQPTDRFVGCIVSVYSTAPGYWGLYIYIYIYIYIHPHTDCFVVSQLFCVVRPARCFKLGSKSGWLYVSRIPYLRNIIVLSLREGIFNVNFLHIRYRQPEVFNSWEELLYFSVRNSGQNFPLKSSTHSGEHIYIYIYIYI